MQLNGVLLECVVFRIKMCAYVTVEDFFTIHHELGHIQYFIEYKNQTFYFKKGANDGSSKIPSNNPFFSQLRSKFFAFSFS